CSIFDDIGDYTPSTSKTREGERSRKRRHSYFEKPRADDEAMDIDKGPGSVKDQIKLINEKFAGAAHFTGSRREEKKHLGDFFGMSNSYAESYPATTDDLAVDSDEEVDYSKMDQA
uniref:Uncharacterized protein n=2 Tax=Cyprinus carpio TaxID=7962 RepID=A0A9J7ZPM3_CYPCA